MYLQINEIHANVRLNSFFSSCKSNSLNEILFYTSNWPVTPKIKLHHADGFSCIILRIMGNDFIRATYKQKWQKIHKPNKTSCKTYEKGRNFYSDIDRLGKCFSFFIYNRAFFIIIHVSLKQFVRIDHFWLIIKSKKEVILWTFF